MRDYRRGWMKGDCPDCGKVDKFGINLSMNRTNCFYCGYHPNPITVIMNYENLSNYSDVIKIINGFEGLTQYEPLVEK